MPLPTSARTSALYVLADVADSLTNTLDWVGDRVSRLGNASERLARFLEKRAERTVSRRAGPWPPDFDPDRPGHWRGDMFVPTGPGTGHVGREAFDPETDR